MSCLLTSVAGRDRPQLLARLRDLSVSGRFDWLCVIARRNLENELTRLNKPPDTLGLAPQFAAALLWHGTTAAPPGHESPEATPYRPFLWAHGLSGDRPVIVGCIDDRSAAPPWVAELLDMQAYLGSRGVMFDVLLLFAGPGGYAQPRQADVEVALADVQSRFDGQPRGDVRVVAEAILGSEHRSALLASARFVFDMPGGSLQQCLAAAVTDAVAAPAFIPIPSAPVERIDDERQIEPGPALDFDNGFGGFDGDAYVVRVEPDLRPPAPWSQVLANPTFGTLVTDSGLGHSWFRNSGELQLTRWANDPTLDRSNEALYLRDEETAAVWSPLPGPMPVTKPYRVRYEPGQAGYEHHRHGLRQSVLVTVPPNDAVKIVRLTLRNDWPRARRITATYYARWQLDSPVGGGRWFVTTHYDPALETLFARNDYDVHTDCSAFLSVDAPVHGYTTDRREFLGADFDPARPAALNRYGLADSDRHRGDPCAVLQVHVDLAPGEATALHFVIGAADTPEAAQTLAARYRRREQLSDAVASARSFWQRHLGQFSVESPAPSLDRLVRTWLPYQATVGRLWGRSGYYQAGGGYGFRDQLQDALGLRYLDTGALREQILRAAAVQFADGDVLHWWHERPLRGVRTLIADDLLWLPFVVARYLETSGDAGLLTEQVPYLSGDALDETEHERYSEYAAGADTATVYEHCCSALEARRVTGVHGLPLFGTGDWNDGMNRVGAGGRGESVWLAWFHVVVYRDFAAVCRQRGDTDRERRYAAHAATMETAIRANGWDGEWYRRGFYDDGTVLGGRDSAECRIDLNAQTWAILAGGRDRARLDRALDACTEHLYDAENRLIRLLAPPFDTGSEDPGYIKAYPPGVRENGGQYTHAAV
ncbi:MAG: hypothetical protein AAFX58_12395, partial [Pseudomonadota bacterium]